MKPISLDDFEKDAGEVTLRGRTLRVRPIDGNGRRLIRSRVEAAQEAQSASPADRQRLEGDMEAALYRVARDCLPELSEEEVGALQLSQIEVVLKIATGKVEEVEAEHARRNGSRPRKAAAKRGTPSPPR